MILKHLIKFIVMNKYVFSFFGRQSGAIGIKYGITDSYEANSLGEAMYMVYTDYDMGHPFKVTENGKEIPYEIAKDVQFVKTDYVVKPNRK